MSIVSGPASQRTCTVANFKYRVFSSVTKVQPLTCYDMCEHSTTSLNSNYSKLCVFTTCSVVNFEFRVFSSVTTMSLVQPLTCYGM
ncbi:hypothetical protein J6590_015085 [Homalodisca vitripennis]|nr:hypothetical protein J6590_015085 [Homalodisca vitripennis]